MRTSAILARIAALSMLVAHTVPVSLAASGQVLIDNPEEEAVVENTIDVESTTDNSVTQEAGDGVQENVEIEGDAQVHVDADQVLDAHHDIDIDQECTTGTGNHLCIEDASPQVTTTAVQEIDASATNTMNVTQVAGTGSSQSVTADGTAHTTVDATQTVTSETIIDIFQECNMQTGVCIQRALPDVLTLASQVIAATAMNTLDVMQDAGSGSTQEVDADLEADVRVTAEQFVSPRTFLELTQLCTIDIGMCVQRAAPIVQTAVEQVITAYASNETDIDQNGGQSQSADVDSDSHTSVDATTNVDAQTTINMLQRCGVRQGLCLQVGSDGQPVYVFSDGEQTSTGTYVGELDETPLMNEYSRATVAGVAGGICGITKTCTMLDQLLLWLFGPEPVAEEPSDAGSAQQGSPNESNAKRGHETNVYGASVRFLAAYIGNDLTVAPGAFGGGSDVALSDDQKALFCSMRKKLPNEEQHAAVWNWTAQQLSSLTGLPIETANSSLRDPSVCPQLVAQTIDPIIMTLFPVAHDGPLSGNNLWNKCIRGANVTLEDIKNNPDRKEDGTPRTCGSYHTQDSWRHPDLGVYFQWNRHTGRLELPEGYAVSVTEV